MLGSRLKELRIKKNMSQQRLADLSDVDRTTISKYELKNVHPSYEVLDKICHALNIKPEYLTSPDNDYIKYKQKPMELIDLLKEADYTIQDYPVSLKVKKRISRMVEILFYNDIKK